MPGNDSSVNDYQWFSQKGKITLKIHTKVTFDRVTTASTFFSCRIPNSQQQVYTVAVVFVFPNK